ncbi:MAG: DUF3164 family protein [Desulfobacteraceae bacterium]|nr:DUF3164 family protein [Desulfobacteraceae bacterium]
MENRDPQYMADAQGRLVPVAQIRQIDLERDFLVKEIFGKANELSGVLAGFKEKTLGDIQAFTELSAEKYGAKLGGKKGNVTLMSFDGRIKLQRSIDEHLVFDERLQAAKSLIDECINQWAENSDPKIKALIGDAFQVDKAGRLNVNRILGLRRLNFEDERWSRAMTAIGESLQVVGSKAYIRIYTRHADGEYKPLPLDVAA